MGRPRSVLWLIIALGLTAAVVDFPRVPVKFSLGPVKIDTVLVHPKINFLGINRDLEPKLGLDLSGGTHLVLSADMSEVTVDNRDDAAAASREIVERRVNLFGLSEPVVQTAKIGEEYRIIAELPGIKDVGTAVKLIGTTAKLDFRESAKPTATPAVTAQTTNFIPTGLAGKDLKKSQVVFDPTTAAPQVALEFTPEGAKKFEEITRRNLGAQVAIFLDDQPISIPTVQTVITGGAAVITGDFTTQEAKNLSIQLNAGALPVPIKVVEQRDIGPALGAESIEKSLIAASIGLAIVAGFMIANYGFIGLLAVLALFFYTLAVFAIFKLIPVTLTLAGIAGFILSVGMAVDANILIFERMKEEIRWGHSKVAAVDLGFKRAWTSIRDSNVSTLITCGILYYFGSGIVRGFAITLAIGVAFSMFSAITVTRNFLRAFLRI